MCGWSNFDTLTGIKSVDSGVIDSAIGLGMTKLQILYMIELPLSLSIIMAGIRNALIVGIGITAIGTFIGAGGLGEIIQRGVNVTTGTSIILAGSIPTALMAIVADTILTFIENNLKSKLS